VGEGWRALALALAALSAQNLPNQPPAGRQKCSASAVQESPAGPASSSPSSSSSCSCTVNWIQRSPFLSLFQIYPSTYPFLTFLTLPSFPFPFLSYSSFLIPPPLPPTNTADFHSLCLFVLPSPPPTIRTSALDMAANLLFPLH
jgi:hypothetical protein